MECGELLVWSLKTRGVVARELLGPGVHQLKFNKMQDKLLAVSSKGGSGNYVGCAFVRSFPQLEVLFDLSWSIRKLVEVVWTADEELLVSYGLEKQKPLLFVFSAEDGSLLYRVPVKYPGIKEALMLVALPDRPTLVALVDPGQAALFDVTSRKLVRCIGCWDGSSSSCGRWGLWAPPSGGLDLLDLKTGDLVRTLIPKVAEGIFDVIAMFNATDEYVLYYHSGRKTVRTFRRRDGVQIANYRVAADLRGMASTAEGRGLVLGCGDGSLTTLVIADPAHPGTGEYLASLPSRSLSILCIDDVSGMWTVEKACWKASPTYRTEHPTQAPTTTPSTPTISRCYRMLVLGNQIQILMSLKLHVKYNSVQKCIMKSVMADVPSKVRCHLAVTLSVVHLHYGVLTVHSTLHSMQCTVGK